MEHLYKLVNPELSLISKNIDGELYSSVSLITNISGNINKPSGKRLRPITVLLGAKCFGVVSTEIIDLATVIEFFHISSLLHDDVIDNANKRRGVDAAHIIYGNKATILVGDYLFSKAFQLLAKINNHRIINILANASHVITKGEIIQLLNANNYEMTIDEYMKIINHKTAILFEAAAQMGPIMANAEEDEIMAMGKFGYYLGKAFQIIDDIQDYNSQSQNTGKNIGNDLQEGKITIPLIYALQNATPAEYDALNIAIKAHSKKYLSQVQEIIYRTNAIEKAKELAQEQIDYAITNLLGITPSKYRDGLEDMANHIISL